jgi:hypothetical protein
MGISGDRRCDVCGQPGYVIELRSDPETGPDDGAFCDEHEQDLRELDARCKRL